MPLSIPFPRPFHLVSQKGNQATFVIEGLYPGYGVTIANALRRIALSSLTGGAVVAMKIKDVDHEFSTIPGVSEDVIEILLHLKKIRFRVYGEGVFEGHLVAKGEREVGAGDFKVPSEVEIVNPNLPIATLTDKKALLEITIWITQGIGYELAEAHPLKSLPHGIGVVPIDSIFTPVVGASFEIENMRVGERTDYERITFKIETDGTITPHDATKKTVETLIHQFEAIAKLEPKKEAIPKPLSEVLKEEGVEKGVQGVKETPLSMRFFITHLKLSSRIEKILKRYRIKTIGQLIQKKEEDLMKLDGIGEAAVKEIRRKLGKAGFLLGTK